MLHFLVFISGMTVLGSELAASRLLAPYFGTSLFIWANLIGLILLYLTLGYWLGGRLADRYARRESLYHVTAVAALFIALIPVLARPILYVSSIGFASYSLGIFWGSLMGVIALFIVPMTLLGCVSPWAIRLSVQDVRGAGRTAGTLYALSTLGSIAGAYLPVLLLIPNLGTNRTFFLFSLVLLLTSVGGLLQERRAASPAPVADGVEVVQPATRRGGAAIGVYVVALVVITVIAALPGGIIRAQPYGELLYENESAYNYIQVVKNGTRVDLVLNEGHAVHSIYDPNELLTQGPWDYFLMAPFFSPGVRERDVDSMLMLGSAAGTTPRMYTELFGPIRIDGVEIDPKIIEVGKRYFAMTMPNFNAIAQDARYFLRQTDQRYQVIGVDAYRQPYIPFHLTTREFFQEVKEHLDADGVVAINAGRTEDDYRLVNVLAGTMKDVYPNVFVINIPTAINSIIVGTNKPSTLAEFRANLDTIQEPTLRRVAQIARSNTCEYVPAQQGSAGRGQGAGETCAFAQGLRRMVFTDDLAPVEQVIDQIILGYISGTGTSGR
ncbi:MAG TPA: fused MFS/spermidine synthase [Chloroflexota bacterium]|nr:fused MFS/spermidine synthase [Chloroflexota bacterium]